MATQRKPQAPAAEVVDDNDPIEIPQQVRLDQAPSGPETENRVTRPSDLGFGKAREIEVEPLRDLPITVDHDGTMEIRMAETIEEFTYGNPHFMVRLEEGKRYRVPAHIGQYLIGLGKVYQRA